MKKLSDYIAQFNSQDVVNAFSEIVKADSPSGYLADREVDILDVEIFLDERCVAFDEDGIADLIVKEFKNRADKYFGYVPDKMAREMALIALKNYFTYDCFTLYKADSPFASAFDWLNEKYKFLEIPLDVDGEQTMMLVLDMNECKFDVNNYINPDWTWWDGELTHIMNIAREKINKIVYGD
jgi:hypothetical protein